MTTARYLITTGIGSEREILESFLDFHRTVAVGKVGNQPISAARTQPLPSQTTLAGLLHHLAIVEHKWFQQVLSGEPAPLTAAGADEADSSWAVSGNDALARLVATHEPECDRSRAAAEDRSLDDMGQHPDVGRVSLRWIYVHKIEETARHAGHDDILR